jgi:butyryl-CoA dehydrogenase
MNFQWNEEQIELFKEIQLFASHELAPFASEWDSTSYFPIDIIKKAANLGLAGIFTSHEIGGSGLSRLEACKIFEILATGCVTTTAYLTVHNMVTAIIDKYASQELRQEWGPRLTSMQCFASYCLTEPSAGSDAASLTTRAVLDNDCYIINGTKSFISGGSVSDLYLTIVRTGDSPHEGISAILIPKDTPGISFGKLEQKMGWKAQPTCMVYFTDCRVPAKNIVGEVGQGFKIALNALNGGRLNIAACSLGGAIKALQLTKQYMNERKQFNLKLADMQALRFKFAELYTKLEVSRSFLWRAANYLDNNAYEAKLFCAMAKYYVTDEAFKIADETLQLHGGYGYLHDYSIERIFRDIRVHRILEGTNEIMHEIIAKNTLDQDLIEWDINV